MSFYGDALEELRKFLQNQRTAFTWDSLAHCFDVISAPMRRQLAQDHGGGRAVPLEKGQKSDCLYNIITAPIASKLNSNRIKPSKKAHKTLQLIDNASKFQSIPFVSPIRPW